MAKKLDLHEIRERLTGGGGRQYWRSLEELSDTPEFREFLNREFPREAAVWDESFSRRGFLQLMGASLALAGLSGCVKQPEERIIPYVRQPELIVPGKPLYFATAMPMEGYATGILVKSHMGRPTHIEGNPDHPASLGSLDVFTQASILSLYDPERSQVPIHKGEISTWNKFFEAIAMPLEVQRSLKGAGIRVLTGATTSPTLAAQMQSFKTMFPQSRWHQFEPVGKDNVREGAQLAFGENVETLYRFDLADVVLSLDADFLGEGPAHVRYSRDFASRRKVTSDNADMSRLYVAESTPSIAGGMADHRLRVRAGQIELLARVIAAEIGVSGVSSVRHGFNPEWIAAVVKDLQAHRGSSIVVAGTGQPPVVHALAHAMNAVLGNNGTTVSFTQPVEAPSVNHIESLGALLRDIDAGQVDILVIAGTNPVYSAPADFGLAERLTKVGLSIHLGLYADETGVKSTWHIPESHYLESWSDARGHDGVATIMQPLIAPLYNSKSLHELLDELMGKSGSKGYDIVRNYWKTRSQGQDFEVFWKTSLNDGVVRGTAQASKQATFRVPSGGWKFSQESTGGLELVFRPDPALWDGRFSNNGWLQELPKPFTKLTWDNAAFFSPSTAQNLGLSNNDIIEVRRGDRAIEAPVWIWPGHADDSITLHLGYGRTHAGRVGSNAGVNAYALRTSDAPWFASGVEVQKTGRRSRLAFTQHHHNMEGRHLVRAATVSEYKANPRFAQEMGHTPGPGESFYPAHEYDGYAWGMTIDLNACTGCNACVIACQSENNIPIVGKDQVVAGREMHWIRIDSYFAGNPEDPEMFSQPVTCMHCENAPCEPVCPVAATTHDSEGLNVMTYNRCVGTRYCSNNCPYKVRRFNFLQYSDLETETYKMMRNPDVTVRNRGVMEKCTYCVQRISSARIEAKKEGREIRDGEVVTACQAACPAQAITFGNINDRESKVAKLKAEPRDYGLLAELNTKPRTSYLARLTNPAPGVNEGQS